MADAVRPAGPPPLGRPVGGAARVAGRPSAPARAGPSPAARAPGAEPGQRLRPHRAPRPAPGAVPSGAGCSAPVGALAAAGGAGAARRVLAARRPRCARGRAALSAASAVRAEAGGGAGDLADGAEAHRFGRDDGDDPLARWGDWRVWVVNLARRPDRLERLRGVLQASSPRLLQRLERIDAVDGRKLNFDDPEVQELLEASTLARARRAKRLGLYTVVHDADNWLVHFDDHMTEGAVACAMSHHKALQSIANHPTAEWGLILEDDVSKVVPHADGAIAKVLEQLPEDWDAVYIGYHHDDGKPHPAAEPGSPAAAAAAAPGAEAVVVPASPVLDHCWGLFSLIIRKEAAGQLVDSLFPICTQVDCAVSSWLVRNGRKVYKVPPEQLLMYSPCSEEAQDSDIQTMISEDGVADKYGSMEAYRAKQRESKPSTMDELMADIYGDAWDDLNKIDDEPLDPVWESAWEEGVEEEAPAGEASTEAPAKDSANNM